MGNDESAGRSSPERQRPARIFLAGATGAIGLPLTRMLVAAGYEVVGTTRSIDRARAITSCGARAVVVDVLDAAALAEAMTEAQPDVVIHEVTDLATDPGGKLAAEQLTRNAEVRKVGTRNLIEAAAASGARRLVAQSIAWLYLAGPEPHTEDESIVPEHGGAIDATRSGVIELERMVTTDPRIEGLVLRYGRLYGPRTWSATPVEPPTVHVAAAARATSIAVDRGEPGVYNIVDDGGPVSNSKARSLLGWDPAAAQV